MIEKAKKNLIEKLHTLPLDLQKDVKILLEALEIAQRKPEDDLPGEIWKDIAGYEGLYQVSNFGRVKSFQKPNPQILKALANNKGGYLRVSLTKKRISQQKLIHVLVAEAFLPNPDNLPQVDHKFGDKTDNRACALEWVSQSENISRAFRLGLNRPRKGSEVINAKLIDDEVRYIRTHYKYKDKEFNARALAKKFNVSKTVILNIIHHRKCAEKPPSLDVGR